MSDLWYGLDGWERLEETLEHAVDRAIGESIDWESQECVADVLGKVHWPIVVKEFKHCRKPSAEGILEMVLERLDEDLGDPEGDNTAPTPTMIGHVQAILDEYKVFMCEEAGREHTVTREEAIEMLREGGAK